MIGYFLIPHGLLCRDKSLDLLCFKLGTFQTDAKTTYILGAQWTTFWGSVFFSLKLVKSFELLDINFPDLALQNIMYLIQLGLTC